MREIVNNILSANAADFEQQALQIFQYQYQHNTVYRNWCNALTVQPENVHSILQIPFLPVSFFKSHQVVSGAFQPDVVFESSGTTGSVNSKHFVKDVALYQRSFTEGFRLFYGDPNDWCIIGLLPAYLERQGSSLVMMVDELVKLSNHPQSGFYLYEFGKLAGVLQQLEAQQQKTLLIGVTFALVDFAQQFPMPLRHTVVMETGGMKGRRRELIRQEVHDILQTAFGLPFIHSEYGMTELLSQAYSQGNGVFRTVPWMKILLRDEDDPLTLMTTGRGLLNIIDLANVHSCSFIAIDDVGRLHSNGSFEVLGRRDTSDIRGCSLMVL